MFRSVVCLFWFMHRTALALFPRVHWDYTCMGNCTLVVPHKTSPSSRIKVQPRSWLVRSILWSGHCEMNHHVDHVLQLMTWKKLGRTERRLSREPRPWSRDTRKACGPVMGEVHLAKFNQAGPFWQQIHIPTLRSSMWTARACILRRREQVGQVNYSNMGSAYPRHSPLTVFVILCALWDWLSSPLLMVILQIALVLYGLHISLAKPKFDLGSLRPRRSTC